MNKRQRKKVFEDMEHEMSVQNRQGDFSRARSVTVGTCSGGVTEIMMRGNNSFMWMVLQPVEVIELIHQLAANVGCHIHMQPRNDFASWRNWNYTKEELEHYRAGGGGLLGSGHAPHVNDLAPHVDVGAKLPPPQQQPGLNINIMSEGGKDGKVMATEKLRKRRAAN